MWCRFIKGKKMKTEKKKEELNYLDDQMLRQLIFAAEVAMLLSDELVKMGKIKMQQIKQSEEDKNMF